MVSRSSLLRLLAFGRSAETATERDRLGLERVRTQMLQLLSRYEGAAFYRVAERIRYADEMECLWYLRQDLMAALSEVHGEVAARNAVAPLNALFKGQLPAALTATPARPRVGP